MQLSNIPGKLILPFANAGSKNAIPVASQIGIHAGAASLTDGFPPLTMTPVAAGGVPPSGLDMNGILYEMSNILRWANAGGGYAYDSDFASDSNVGGYPKGARVMRSDGTGYWFNTVDNNVTDPEAAGAAAAGWVPDYQTGAAAVTMTSANVTLTPAQYGKPLIVITGALTGNLNLIFPALVEGWTVINNTTGGYVITAKTASGSGVALGTISQIVGDGTSIYAANPDSVQIVTNVATLRNIAPTLSRRIQTKGYYTDGDGGSGQYYAKVGAAPGTYVHNGGTVIVPNGGDGSSAWLLDITQPVNVRQFGAKGDGNGSGGGTDNTSAFQAIKAWGKPFFVPAGIYRVDGIVATDASPAYNFYMEGASEAHAGFSGNGQCVIDLTNNTQYFACVGYDHTIKNISFQGGVDVLHHTSSGTDGNTSKLIDVFANQWSGTFFKGITPGNGSHISWVRPVLVSSLTSAVIYDSVTMGGDGFDNLSVFDPWFETASTVGFKWNSGRLSFKSGRLVPYTSANSVWFDCYSASHVFFEDTDFGGESSRKMINWRTAGGDITFMNCGLFGIAGGVGINLVAPPVSINFNTCTLSSNPTQLISLDPAISATNYELVASMQVTTIGCPWYLNSNLGNWNYQALAATIAATPVNQSQGFVQVSELLGSTGFPWQSGGSGVNVTQANNVTDPLGGGTWNYQFTATADNASVNAQMNGGPGISTLPNGNLTFECVVYVSQYNATVDLLFGDRYRSFNLAHGTHHLCFPVYFNSSTNRSIGFQIAMPSVAIVSIGQFKVFKGNYNSRKFEVMGTAAPTSTAVNWEKGNRVINSVPTVGQPKSWVCTVSGAPGTWVSEGNL